MKLRGRHEVLFKEDDFQGVAPIRQGEQRRETEASLEGYPVALVQAISLREDLRALPGRSSKQLGSAPAGVV